MLHRLAPNRLSRLLLTAAALLLALTAASPRANAQAHRKHAAREQIVALEQQWRQAQLTGDVSVMDKLLSDDFLGINVSGEVVTKAQQLDRMRSRKLSISKLDTSDVKVKLIGEIAIVTSLATIVSKGDSGNLNGSFRSTRVWQHLSSGGWKLTSFEATRIRPLPPGDAPPPPPPARD